MIVDAVVQASRATNQPKLLDKIAKLTDWFETHTCLSNVEGVLRSQGGWEVIYTPNKSTRMLEDCNSLCP